MWGGGGGVAEMSAGGEGINRRQFYYEVYTHTDECCCWSLAPAGDDVGYLRAATRQDPAHILRNI